MNVLPRKSLLTTSRRRSSIGVLESSKQNEKTTLFVFPALFLLASQRTLNAVLASLHRGHSYIEGRDLCAPHWSPRPLLRLALCRSSVVRMALPEPNHFDIHTSRDLLPLQKRSATVLKLICKLLHLHVSAHPP